MSVTVAVTLVTNDAVDGFIGKFSLADFENACPTVSRDWIRALLKRLRKEGKVEATGKGQNTLLKDKKRVVGRNIACLKISISDLLAKTANRISIIISTTNLSPIIRDRIRDSRNNHAF